MCQFSVSDAEFVRQYEEAEKCDREQTEADVRDYLRQEEECGGYGNFGSSSDVRARLSFFVQSCVMSLPLCFIVYSLFYHEHSNYDQFYVIVPTRE